MTKTAFAFDVGNGYVKARNEKRNILIPSVIAKESSIGSSSIMGLTNQSNSDYEVFETQLDDGVKYIWGAGIMNAVEPESLIPTYTHHNRYTQKRFKLLCTFILSELASDFTDDEINDVVVVTGLPSQEVGTTEEKEFRNFLQQKHVITRNNVQRVINVTDVRIVEQPMGTLLNLYLTEDGKFHKEFTESAITVIDFGAGTTIMDTFKNVGRLDDKSETFYEGMNDLHRIIAKELERRHNIKGLDPSYIDEGLRRGNMVAEISERKKYPFEEIAKEVIIDFTDKRLSEIDRTLTNRDSIDKFILTGGGVNVVGEVFKEIFEEDKIEIIKDSQMANLNGFFKFSKKLCQIN